MSKLDEIEELVLNYDTSHLTIWELARVDELRQQILNILELKEETMKKRNETRYDKTIQELNDEDVVMLLCEDLQIGMSKPHYTLGQILKQHEANYVSKVELVGTYLDDLLNCKTKEEMIEYIEQLIKEWD